MDLLNKIINFLNNKKIEWLLFYSAIFLLAILIGLKFYSVLIINIPHEFREVNLVAFAKSFADGKNLYSFSALKDEIPPATSQYGLLVPLLLAPFVKIGEIFGVEALRIAQLATIFVEIAGLLLVYLIIMKNCGSRLFAIFGAIVSYSCFWRYAAFGGAFPDQWGLTFALLMTYCVIRFEQQKRHKVIIYALICIILFYVKQYFVFNVIGLSLYLFFYFKKDFLKFIFCTALFGAISALLVIKIFPLYFPEAIALTSVAVGDAGWSFSLLQITNMAFHYYPLVSVVYICLVFYQVVNFIDERRKKTEAGTTNKGKYIFMQSICMLPIVAVLSRNIGTYYTYYLQLWWIYVILYAFINLSDAVSFVADKMSNRIKYSKGLTEILLLLITVFAVSHFILEKPLNFSQRNDWNKAYGILDMYRNKGEILLSPHLSAYCIEHNIQTSDYGQAEFNSTGNLKHFKNHWLYPEIFPETERILLKNIEYNRQIKENVRNREYVLVALTDTGNYSLTEEEIEVAGYKEMEEIILVTGTQKWKTKFYIVNNPAY